MAKPPPRMVHETLQTFQAPKRDPDNLIDGLNLQELLDLKTRIELKLPAKDLKDLDLSRELVLQFLALQQLQSDVLNNDNVPANQQAQVANSLSAALTSLVKLQADVVTAERMKKLETVMIDALNKLPDDVRSEALETYAQAIGTLS